MGGSAGEKESDVKSAQHREVPDNLAQENRQGDKKQNTTHKGYQQDR